MEYDIISSNSTGNCLVLDGKIAVDMGVSFKAIRPYMGSIQLILLTHRHFDHANLATITVLSKKRPSVRFAVPPWLAHAPSRNVDVCAMDVWYDYGICRIQPFELFHDVPQCGWRIEYDGKHILYATDTSRIDHIHAPDLDYYFIEANHDEDEIKERIAEKEAVGEYVHEYRTAETHLSKQKADAWIMKNAADWSVIEYMHGHKE